MCYTGLQTEIALLHHSTPEARCAVVMRVSDLLGLFSGPRSPLSLPYRVQKIHYIHDIEFFKPV